MFKKFLLLPILLATLAVAQSPVPSAPKRALPIGGDDDVAMPEITLDQPPGFPKSIQSCAVVTRRWQAQ